MTDEEIFKMNTVIADFMGYYYHAGKFYGKERGSWFKEAKYHTSWDWLMPVGKRIRDLLQDMLKKRPPHTACKGDLIEVDIHCAISEYDIAKAHKFIYQFITWYNQQTTTNE